MICSRQQVSLRHPFKFSEKKKKKKKERKKERKKGAQNLDTRI
jgi:hypothetical protein